jgi:hypothetical protein
LVIDIPVSRVVSRPGLDATGEPEVSGASWPEAPAPQQPPAKGTGPRVDTATFARSARKMPHQVVAYRAGVAAHAFRPQAAGVSDKVGTGWLEVTDDAVIWAPHTAGGFSSPPSKTFHLLGNGLLSKHLIRKLRRDGTLDELARLRAGASS